MMLKGRKHICTSANVLYGMYLFCAWNYYPLISSVAEMRQMFQDFSVHFPKHWCCLRALLTWVTLYSYFATLLSAPHYFAELLFWYRLNCIFVSYSSVYYWLRIECLWITDWHFINVWLQLMWLPAMLNPKSKWHY